MKILVADWDSGGVWKPSRRWSGGRYGAAVSASLDGLDLADVALDGA